MKDKSRRPTPGFVIGLIALAVALSGTAWAATKIDTEDIKSKAITSKKLDTAAGKNVIHANVAARTKSRISHAIKALKGK